MVKSAQAKKRRPQLAKVKAKPVQAICFHDVAESATQAALRRFGKLFASHDFTLQEAVSDAVGLAANDTVLVVVSSPRDALAQALAQGVAPEVAFPDVASRTQELLEVCRGARRKVLLVDVNSVFQLEPSVLTTLSERLGAKAAKLRRAPAPQQPDSKYALLADALLSADVAFSRNSDELQAMTLGALERAEMYRGALLKSWADWQHESQLAVEHAQDTRKLTAQLQAQKARNAELKQYEVSYNTLKGEALIREEELLLLKEELSLVLSTRKNEVEEEITLLKDQLSLVQDARSEDAEERDLLRETLSQLTGQTGALQGRVASLEAELRERASELGVLNLQLSQTQAERDDIRQRLRERNKHTAELKAVIEGLYTSTSWRLTAPMRAIKRRFSRS